MMIMRPFKRRPGSTFIVVIGAAMLIAAFMLAGLSLIRIQWIRFQNSADIHQARLYAESALDLGLHHVRENETTWRSGGIDLDAIYGQYQGIELSISDPLDGDISDSYNDPVVMLATGTYGSAVQKIRARCQLDAQGYNCLESAMHAGSDVALKASRLNFSEFLSYDATLAMQTSVVNNSVTGPVAPAMDVASSINGSIDVPGDSPKETPAADNVNPLDAYRNDSVDISLSDLWMSDHSLNRISNHSFAQGLTDWIAVDCAAVLEKNYILVTNRTNGQASITQDVTELVYADVSYKVLTGIYNPNRSDCIASIVLKIETSTGTHVFSAGSAVVPSEKWSQIGGALRPQWTGELVSATWMIGIQYQGLTEIGFPDYAIVQPTLSDVTFPDGSYVINNKLLTANHNPFGSGQLQESGIYRLDAQSKEVYLQNLRLVGTLLLENSKNVTIQKAVNLSSHVVNYPTILAADNLTIALSDGVLNEESAAANFNPTGAPYSSIEDADNNDQLASRIDGLVYVHGDLTINGVLKSMGVWIANGNLVVNSGDVDIEHLKLYRNEPPPGFVRHTDLTVVPGSFRQGIQ